MRKVSVGPVALHFSFARAVQVTHNSGRRIKMAALRHKVWNQSWQIKPIEGNADSKAQEVPTHSPSSGTALIVGVGPGLGYALARRLASEGMAVALASRNAIRLDALVHEIESTGGTAYSYGCDATSEASVAELFACLKTHHEIPSLVVYSLQSFGPGQTIEIELPAFEEGWKHNCLGAFLVARQAARCMLPLGCGTIVFIGSTSSMVGREGHLNLAIGKFGQRALAQVLARELWPKGVHVAHLVIDADICEGEEPMKAIPQADPNHVADVVVSIHRQPRSAWTSEIDVRPWNEQFWVHC